MVIFRHPGVVILTQQALTGSINNQYSSFLILSNHFPCTVVIACQKDTHDWLEAGIFHGDSYSKRASVSSLDSVEIPIQASGFWVDAKERKLFLR